jgi:heme oxygenase (biliverdin-IX-beta and delta-forming)
MLSEAERLSLPSRLRAETAGVHQRLEDDMAFEQRLPDHGRLRLMLERFYGLNAALEPILQRHLGPDLTEGRSKLAHLTADLVALGDTQADIDAVPICKVFADQSNSPDGALGALYVMEGSTLGGKVITKLLKQSSIWPIGGIRYFDPYGSDAGTMWKRFKLHLDSIDDPQQQDRIIASARTAFMTVHHWLSPAFPSAR